MLGLGGGVFLVPFLNAALGFPLNVASGVGLMTVVATSSVVARGTGRGLVNLRLGMVLQIAAATGGYFGGTYAEQIPEHALQLTFATVTAAIAAISGRVALKDASAGKARLVSPLPEGSDTRGPPPSGCSEGGRGRRRAPCARS